MREPIHVTLIPGPWRVVVTKPHKLYRLRPGYVLAKTPFFPSPGRCFTRHGYVGNVDHFETRQEARDAIRKYEGLLMTRVIGGLH